MSEGLLDYLKAIPHHEDRLLILVRDLYAASPITYDEGETYANIPGFKSLQHMRKVANRLVTLGLLEKMSVPILDLSDSPKSSRPAVFYRPTEAGFKQREKILKVHPPSDDSIKGYLTAVSYPKF